MSDWDERHPHEPRDPSEGVRIIGPDEEAARTDPRSRVRPRPRRGDMPPPDPRDRGGPTVRFPLDPEEEDQRPPIVPVEGRRPQPDMSHWAPPDPATQQPDHEPPPEMNRRDPYEGDEAAAWNSFGGAEPRWRDDRQPYVEPPPGRSVFGDDSAPQAGAYEDAYRDQSYDDEPGYQSQAQAPYRDRSYSDAGYDPRRVPADTRYDEAYDDSYSDDVYQETPRSFAEPPPPPSPRQAQPPPSRRRAPAEGDRDMRLAVLVGAALAATALVLFRFGPVATMFLVIAVLGVASFEYFTATQRAGFDPLMPVGVVATVGAVIAAYNYGESAVLLVLVLSLAVCMVWYLIGAGGERPMANVGATLLGIGWVGLLGAFAGLLLGGPNGIALLLAALVPTIGYDVGALFVGRSAGSRPLSAASPNKTIEGLVGGMVLAVVGGLLLGVFDIDPFDSIGEGLKIGLVAAVAAPIGDLSESLIKRDLGIKDMGSLLPGHGGVLDRFDALLFVLPAIWYTARVSDFFLL